MKRSGFKRKTPAWATKTVAAPDVDCECCEPAYKPLPKLPPIPRKPTKATAARKSARDQDCTLCFPGCPNDRDTVVLCHVRQLGGGGTGLKPDDAEAVYGDRYCHDRLDGRVNLWLDAGDSIYEYIARALVRTHRVMRKAGVLIFKGEAK